MLALPPDEQQLLTRVSQYLLCRGIIPVVVRSPTEALIHSRHSRFAIIVLPDSDPTLIRKVRSAMKIILITSKPYLRKAKHFFVIIKGLTIDPVFQIKETKSNKNNLNNLFICQFTLLQLAWPTGCK